MKTLLGAFFALLLLTSGAWAQAYCPNNSPTTTVVAATTYTIGQRDRCNIIVFTSSSAIAVSLPGPGTAGGFTGNFNMAIFALGTGTVTITPQPYPTGGTTPLINGAATATVTTGTARTILLGTDGNWYAPPGV